LVDVSEFIPDAVLDIRYATANNFVGVALYDQATCLLRPEVAKRLRRAAALLRKRGYRLRLWDCYRPFSVQEALYRKVSDPRYVGKPKRGADGKPLKGSRHNRGAAVDVSLVTIDGKYVRMPTDYDDFSRRAHRSELAKGGKGAGNARVLEAAMSEAGFVGLATEWWHFDAEGWQRFALLDIAFQDLN
jgi:D-alanyl-D-alanine dipeptidase